MLYVKQPLTEQGNSYCKQQELSGEKSKYNDTTSTRTIEKRQAQKKDTRIAGSEMVSAFNAGQLY